MSKDEMKHTNLNVKERNVLTLNGVSNIESFDEGYISLEIGEGRISVEGNGLKIESLSREGGEIQITGRINGVYYSEKKKRINGVRGLFK
jgi:sporulation protein YabP